MTSITEAEYVALYQTTMQEVQIVNQSRELYEENFIPVEIYCETTSTTAIVNRKRH